MVNIKYILGLVFIIIVSCTLLSSCKQKKDFVDGLEKFELENKGEFIELDLEKAKEFLVAVEKVDDFYIWKGYKYGKLTYSNGKTLRVKVSDYGGFFYSEDLGSLYELPKEKREEWQEFIGRPAIKL